MSSSLMTGGLAYTNCLIFSVDGLNGIGPFCICGKLELVVAEKGEMVKDGMAMGFRT